MASHVTRAVRFFSSVHSSVGAIRSGNLHPVTAFKNTFFTPTRFPYVLGVLAIGSFTLGWRGMDHVRDESERQDLEEYISEERRRAQDQHLIRRRTYFPVNIGAGATSLPVTMTVPNE